MHIERNSVRAAQTCAHARRRTKFRRRIGAPGTGAGNDMGGKTNAMDTEMSDPDLVEQTMIEGDSSRFKMYNKVRSDPDLVEQTMIEGDAESLARYMQVGERDGLDKDGHSDLTETDSHMAESLARYMQVGESDCLDKDGHSDLTDAEHILSGRAGGGVAARQQNGRLIEADPARRRTHETAPGSWALTQAARSKELGCGREQSRGRHGYLVRTGESAPKRRWDMGGSMEIDC